MNTDESEEQERSSEAVIEETPAASPPRLIELPKCETLPKEVMAPVEQFLIASMKDHTQSNYTAVCDGLRRAEDGDTFYRVLIALRTSSGVLHQLVTSSKHARLVHIILRSNPFFISKRFQEDQNYCQLVKSFKLPTAWLNLVVAMVSANPVYTSPALNVLWTMMKTQPEGRHLLTVTIATILRLSPQGASQLTTIVSTQFPFHGLTKDQILDYAMIVLGIIDYAPILHGPLLELLVEKALEMDVEIKISDEGSVSIDPEKFARPENDDALFPMEVSDQAKTPLSKNTKESNEDARIDSTAEKLDGLMELILNHLKEFIQKNPTHNARASYLLMAPIFERLILPTYRSKFVQFIMMVICSLDPNNLHPEEINELYRDFCGKLLEVVMDPDRATVTRQSAACYLASFVSRSNFVCSETACESVSALLRWSEMYMEAVETLPALSFQSQCSAHSLFYTVCQASFYMLCFRGKEAMEYYFEALDWYKENPIFDDDEPPFPELSLVDIGPERWEGLCKNKLQPLRFCLESVREEFLHTSAHFNLLKPGVIHELSKTIGDGNLSSDLVLRRPRGRALTLPKRRRRGGGVGGLGKGSNPLNSFFPFDPYLLRRSHHFIDPLYRHWEGNYFEDALKTTTPPNLQQDEDSVQIEHDTDGGSAHCSPQTDLVFDDDDDDDDGGDECGLEEHHEHMAVSYESQRMFDNLPSQAPCKEDWRMVLKRPRAPSIADSVGSGW